MTIHQTPPPPSAYARLKTALAPVFAAFALSACVTSAPIGKPVEVEAGEDFRAGARNAGTLLVHEGLPHQAKERGLMAREAARRDVTEIEGYSFYAPAVAAKRPAALKKVLNDAASYAVYTGPKTCGGFHPDYAVSWKSGGKTGRVLICFGCGEVLFSDGERRLPYDLTPASLGELREILSLHAAKRPPAGR